MDWSSRSVEKIYKCWLSSFFFIFSVSMLSQHPTKKEKKQKNNHNRQKVNNLFLTTPNLNHSTNHDGYAYKPGRWNSGSLKEMITRLYCTYTVSVKIKIILD